MFRSKRRRNEGMSPIEALGITPFGATAQIRDMLGDLTDAGATRLDVQPSDPVLEQRYLTMFLGATTAAPLFPQLSEYLGVQKYLTGATVVGALANRWVPAASEAERLETYELFARYLAARTEHPDDFGGDRMTTVVRLLRACYPAVDWTSAPLPLPRLVEHVEAATVEFAAARFLENYEDQIDWSITRNTWSPGANEMAERLQLSPLG
jgi:hypothetical protein